MDYYIVRGKDIIGTVEMGEGDVTALPLIVGNDAMSLISVDTVFAAETNKSTADKVAYLGLVDKRAKTL